MILSRFKLLIIGALLAILVLSYTIFAVFNTSRVSKSSPAPVALEPPAAVVQNAKELLKFKRAKYQLFPYLDGQEGVQNYILGKAKISYLPLPNIFEGYVEQALNLEEYRKEKIKITEDLKEKGVDICGLEIFWIRPQVVAIKDLTVEDLKTDGCD